MKKTEASTGVRGIEHWGNKNYRIQSDKAAQNEKNKKNLLNPTEKKKQIIKTKC